MPSLKWSWWNPLQTKRSVTPGRWCFSGNLSPQALKTEVTGVREKRPGGPRGRRPLLTSSHDPAALIGPVRSGSLIGYSLPQMTFNLFGREVIGGLLEATAHKLQRKSAGKPRTERILIKLMVRPRRKNTFEWREDRQSDFSLLIVMITKHRRLNTKGPFPWCFVSVSCGSRK